MAKKIQKITRRQSYPHDAWIELEDILNAYDGDFRIDIGSSCCYSGELRLTITNPQHKPSRSMTFYSTGGDTAASVIWELLTDATQWLNAGGDKEIEIGKTEESAWRAKLPA